MLDWEAAAEWTGLGVVSAADSADVTSGSLDMLVGVWC